MHKLNFKKQVTLTNMHKLYKKRAYITSENKRAGTNMRACVRKHIDGTTKCYTKTNNFH